LGNNALLLIKLAWLNGIGTIGACHREQFVNNANDLNGIDILTNISFWS